VILCLALLYSAQNAESARTPSWVVTFSSDVRQTSLLRVDIALKFPRFAVVHEDLCSSSSTFVPVHSEVEGALRLGPLCGGIPDQSTAVLEVKDEMSKQHIQSQTTTRPASLGICSWNA